MKCKHCGEEISYGSNFCEYCGAKVKKRMPWRVILLIVLGVALFAFLLRPPHSQENGYSGETTEEPVDEVVEETPAAIDEVVEVAEVPAPTEEETPVVKIERKQEGEDAAARAAEMKAQGFVDLGLPSGTWWKKNSEDDCMSYKAAISKYGNKIPTREQWEELIKQCKWVWHGEVEDVYGVTEDGQKTFGFRLNYRYEITGKNGNSITLKANGYVIDEEGLCIGGGGVGGIAGYYFSSTKKNNSIWYLYFDSEEAVCIKWENYFKDYTYKLDIQLVKVF